MDEGGEWQNELWAGLCSERRIKLLFRGVSAHHWILERRNGPAHGIYNRLKEDDRFPVRQILAGAQWRLNTLTSGGGFSAYQTVFGPNQANLYGWEDKDEDLAFAQDASLLGQFVQQWKLPMVAQAAALKEIASSLPRRLLAFNKSPTCTDVKIGDTVLLYKGRSKKSIPRWRGPALILDIDETGATAELQSRTFKVARF